MIALRICLLLLFPLFAWADTLYKSVDPDGSIIYSQKPPSGSHVEKTIEYKPAPSSPLPDYAVRYQEELAKKSPQKSTTAQATSNDAQLFTTSWCGFCHRAKAYLTKKNIAYTEYDVETPSGREALAVRVGAGMQGVPILLWRGKTLQGFTEAEYDAFFGS